MKRSLIALLVLLTLGGGALAACSSEEREGSEGSEGSFNDADVAFAQGMIPHHEQAVEMADLAGTRAERPQVKELAMRIKSAQDPEIERMQGWLEEWGEPEQADSPGGGHDDGGHGGGSDEGSTGSGMMTADQMKELEGAKGAKFDRLFLTMMIEHHEGAIEMSKVERSDGKSKDAKALAQDIIAAQEAEIAEMRDLLGQEAG